MAANYIAAHSIANPKYLIRSNPSSENYGKFWTEEETIRMFAPSDESIKTVKN